MLIYYHSFLSELFSVLVYQLHPLHYLSYIVIEEAGEGTTVTEERNHRNNTSTRELDPSFRSPWPIVFSLLEFVELENVERK